MMARIREREAFAEATGTNWGQNSASSKDCPSEETPTKPSAKPPAKLRKGDKSEEGAEK